MSIFYGIETEIRTGFGPIDIGEKKIGLIISNFWGQFFYVFMCKIIFISKNIVAFALKNYIEWNF